MAQQIYLIIQQDEILLDKMINPNNWKRLKILTTSKYKIITWHNKQL